ncbi:beta-1,3-galactosyltransferase 5-like [Diadema antillarum]|uniref:beta-1,3-galactosyltransferase 5-like n=1 Tax=Diadema antillarum TaxID=105358 RepID=UPI003A88A278
MATRSTLRHFLRLIIITTACPILVWQAKKSLLQHEYKNKAVRFEQVILRHNSHVPVNEQSYSNLTGLRKGGPYVIQTKREPANATEHTAGLGVDSEQGVTAEFTIDDWVSEIDKHEYPYIINPDDTCLVRRSIPEEILLVIAVYSAPSNRARRDAVRHTYGNQSVWPVSTEGAPMVRVVFMLGATNDKSLQSQLEEESDLYGDIVQEAFQDTYLNLTRKTVMTLKWVTSFCRNAIYMMKVDDDVILNVERVTNFLLLSPSEDFTAGARSRRAQVMRDKRMKYYTPKHVYNLTHYEPYYMGGAGYFLSLDVAARILDVAVSTPLFPWEDIFVSMCMRELGIPITRTKHFSWSRFTVSDGRLIKDSQTETFRKNCLVGTGLPARHMMKLWKLTQESN